MMFFNVKFIIVATMRWETPWNVSSYVPNVPIYRQNIEHFRINAIKLNDAYDCIMY